MSIDKKRIISILNNNAITNNDKTESEIALNLFRKLPVSTRKRQVARMDGFVEALETRVVTQQVT